MPQNKQMKIQWVTIDGRNVPFVLPQVWDESKKDWVVTSDVNPLPTKDDLVLDKLADLEDKIQATNDKLDGTINTQLTGSNVGYSTDTKPDGKEGDSFIELDTKKVFLHDGTKWSEF